ncbi:hypothetical protein CTI12_AA319920 [Artemisia annua]|uniref:Uncharacterized protein n=1 Tax=Artemisia annua TaxID=35608 RepID=A0A2U1MZN9_ARTAN|nr:hypothetical protein CTI12_AA319920 [Artemisia annua]
MISDMYERISESKASRGVRMAKEVLNRLPHTLHVTQHVNKKDALGERTQFSLHVPGLEKIKDTDEGLCVFLEIDVEQEEDVKSKSVVMQRNALFIRAEVQKPNQSIQGYQGRVNLPEHISYSYSKPIKTEITDGGMMITIPKKAVKPRS